jgi:hypothetical protein
MIVHEFKKSLALSHQYEGAEWWSAVYQKAFPNYLSAVSVRTDGWAQRGGIDRVITLKSGKTITVDEKVRAKSYGDIALEQWSDVERKKPGWMQKDLACDFIAYAFVPDEICYLLPFPILRRAWLENGVEWIANAKGNDGGYRFIDAQNPSYVTRSIAVPITDLLSAISQAQIIKWGAA